MTADKRRLVKVPSFEVDLTRLLAVLGVLLGLLALVLAIAL